MNGIRNNRKVALWVLTLNCWSLFSKRRISVANNLKVNLFISLNWIYILCHSKNDLLIVSTVYVYQESYIDSSMTVIMTHACIISPPPLTIHTLMKM